VLENEQQYREFGIDRRALADILVVTDTGVAVLDRTAAQQTTTTTTTTPTATPLATTVAHSTAANSGSATEGTVSFSHTCALNQFCFSFLRFMKQGNATPGGALTTTTGNFAQAPTPSFDNPADVDSDDTRFDGTALTLPPQATDWQGSASMTEGEYFTRDGVGNQHNYGTSSDAASPASCVRPSSWLLIIVIPPQHTCLFVFFFLKKNSLLVGDCCCIVQWRRRR
jgi:hypothetical protein